MSDIFEHILNQLSKHMEARSTASQYNALVWSQSSFSLYKHGRQIIDLAQMGALVTIRPIVMTPRKSKAI